MAKATTNTATPASSVAAPAPSYLEWGPIIAGGVVATAISLVLVQFAAATGVAAIEPFMPDGSTASWAVLPAGLWIVFTALAASAGGGYIAGRMRMPHPLASDHEVGFRDGTHGLVAWALGTVLAIVGVSIAGLLAAMGAADTAATTVERSDDYLRLAGNASIITGFATAAGATLGAAAGWYFAILGGNHRDEGVDVDLLVPAMFRKR